jgi:hypothetical protein
VNVISIGCAGLIPYQLDHVPLLIDGPHLIESPAIANVIWPVPHARSTRGPRPLGRVQLRSASIIATG